MVLRGVELARGGIELFSDDYPILLPVDAVPSECVELTGTQACEGGDL
jgi:hypothetical protein